MRLLATATLICLVAAGAASPIKPEAPPIEAALAFLNQQPDGFNQTGNAIINGATSSNGQFPWTVAICKHSWGSCSFKVGGALISDRWVLTAFGGLEYDFSDPTIFDIRAGSVDWKSGGQLRSAQLIIHLCDMKDSTHQDDIALIYLNSPFNLNDNVKTIPMTTTDSDVIKPGNFARFAGWGHTSSSLTASVSENLHWADMYISDGSACTKKNHNYWDNKMLCVGGASGSGATCNYDEGGPLFQKKNGLWYLYGISVTWGSQYNTSGCKIPTVFTRVSSYCSWIASITKQYGGSANTVQCV